MKQTTTSTSNRGKKILFKIIDYPLKAIFWFFPLTAFLIQFRSFKSYTDIAVTSLLYIGAFLTGLTLCVKPYFSIGGIILINVGAVIYMILSFVYWFWSGTIEEKLDRTDTKYGLDNLLEWRGFISILFIIISIKDNALKKLI